LLYTAAVANKEAQPEDYLPAVRELHRVLKPGGTLYLSVPFGKAVNHGWFQVFDQRMIESVITAFKPASHTADYFLYQPDGWRNSNALDTANATIFDIHHSKDYDADFAAAARAVCCLELKK
jgi:SAM-dependent methyltransferase